jgi:hypothetical protein
VRRVADIYGICRKKLGRRQQGMPSRRNIVANLRKLSDLKEQTIVQYILNLDTRGFSPRLYGVEDMANRLLAEREIPLVRLRWASNFIKR